MFDVSFFELIVIVVVALVVIGPEKLPKVARTLGALTGRVQRYVAQVKEEVNREVRFDELQVLQNEIRESVTKSQTAIRHEVDVLTHDLAFKDDSTRQVDDKDFRQLEEVHVAESNISDSKQLENKTSKKQQSASASLDPSLKKLVKKRVKKTPTQSI